MTRLAVMILLCMSAVAGAQQMYNPERTYENNLRQRQENLERNQRAAEAQQAWDEWQKREGKKNLEKFNAWIAEVERQRGDVEQQRTVQRAEMAKPDNQLLQAYISYISLRRCYDMRQGYMAMFISEPEMEAARDAVKTIEMKLGPDLTVDKSVLWDNANRSPELVNVEIMQQSYGYGQKYCRMRLVMLMKAYHAFVPMDTKKDF